MVYCSASNGEETANDLLQVFEWRRDNNTVYCSVTNGEETVENLLQSFACRRHNNVVYCRNSHNFCNHGPPLITSLVLRTPDAKLILIINIKI